MKTLGASLTLALAGHVAAHGYVYKISVDNTVYPGWDVYIDSLVTPKPPRIAFGGGGVNPIFNVSAPELACNFGPTPPGAIAEVRAGSNITFNWSRWLYSHKGPITAWLAPYEGDVAKVDVNKLEFFKIAEDTVDGKGVWANVRLMDQSNGTWTATIPADIQPGTYVIRHELMALHFAVSTPPGFEWSPVGPQFYMACFNLNVTSSGTATPKGVTFPGGYSLAKDPGLKFNLSSDKAFTPIGPALYKSAYAANLTPKAIVAISPTGNGTDADNAYYATQNQALQAQAAMTEYFDSIGG
ncbi:glycosyl hydrolase family 61-domain-containing protein [Lasiosphaeria miniovina]|uniref:lytic cellulose monooxygenase (C4-dehydrogenating) n=1 Tax=Lasiosphaeria miniovina TaxID=1954250 RepID=A0AA39ZQW7_9PEZI|nr:glycosyl hydrolase family 61-domain-containing protein [Lasiosphaeria miniovina]KAK0701889.1 glycosyl hydrolase family 61-domain-containing protein [Lasiosphaeria miniovina]